LKRFVIVGFGILFIVINACRVYINPFDPKNSNSSDEDVSSLTTEEIIQPENWALLQDYLDEQTSLGTSGPPFADSNAIAVTADLGKWYGGVLAPNGKIYGIPWNSTSVLIIDPKSNGSFTDTIGLGGYFNKF
jgi:hypothetical protein